MSAVRINTLAEIPPAAMAVLGFEPQDSLVVMGLGSGPTARVDLNDGITEIEALEPAAVHWDRVMLIVFSDHPEAAALRERFESTYPLVTVVDALDVVANTVTSLSLGVTETLAEIAPGILGDRIIADSRADVVAEAQRVTDPAEALRLAAGYYKSGHGAHAWAYVDRARELGADVSEVEGWLLNAINPKDLP